MGRALHRLRGKGGLVGCMILSALACSSIEADTVRPPSGDLRAATIADLKPHPSGSSTYNEFWTYHFFLEGDVQAYLNFSRINLGSFKSPVCGADFTLLGFKGRNYSVAREYEKKNFVFTDSLDQLKVHENIWFSGKLPRTHRVHFSTRKKNVSYFLDLEFSDIAQGRVWGDGMFRLGSETIGIFMHIPRARVSGRLGINGDTIRVAGTAYMDHTFQTALAPELVDAGFRYISHTAAGPGAAAEVGYFLDPDKRYGSSPIGYGLRQQEGAVTLLKPSAIKVQATNRCMGIKVPTRMEVAFQGGSSAVLDRTTDRHQQSYLHEFSGFTKLAIKKYMGGEILAFKGLGRLNQSHPMAYSYFLID